jgi:hypothetical protein
MFVSIDMKICHPLVTPLRTADPNQPYGRIRTIRWFLLCWCCAGAGIDGGDGDGGDDGVGDGAAGGRASGGDGGVAGSGCRKHTTMRWSREEIVKKLAQVVHNEKYCETRKGWSERSKKPTGVW